jgi:hypothetical protein
MTTKSVSSDIQLTPSDPIAFGDYVDGVRIAAPYMKSLAMTLGNAKPDDLDAAGRKQLALLADIAKHGDDVLDERQSVARIRPTLLEFGSAWVALYEALLAKSRLPVSLSDRGERASVLLGQIFPDGVSFVRRDAHAAWSDADRRLAHVVDLGLAREIDQVAGEEHLDVAQKTTDALGEALGVGKTRRETVKGSDLSDTVARFSREVARYARMMAASVDVTDAASINRFRAAVAEPIDALRSRRGGPADAVEPVSPVAADATNAAPPTTQPTITTQPTEVPAA